PIPGLQDPSGPLSIRACWLAACSRLAARHHPVGSQDWDIVWVHQGNLLLWQGASSDRFGTHAGRLQSRTACDFAEYCRKYS
ncbi:MAG: hypothetical protein ACJ8AI_10895, partial [Rhodopila sp.]